MRGTNNVPIPPVRLMLRRVISSDNLLRIKDTLFQDPNKFKETLYQDLHTV